MKKNKMCLLALISCLAACAIEQGKDSAPSKEEVLASLQEQGLTCAVQKAIIAFDAEKGATAEFRQMVSAKLSQDELSVIVEHRETGCAQSETAAGTVVQQITDTRKDQLIPKVASNAGTRPNSIFRDSSANGWMCQPKFPADYIAQYHLAGAYSLASNLRISATNIWARCYIRNPSTARVYLDDDVRVCFGYWSVFFCGALTPLPNDSLIWLQ